MPPPTPRPRIPFPAPARLFHPPPYSTPHAPAYSTPTPLSRFQKIPHPLLPPLIPNPRLLLTSVVIHRPKCYITDRRFSNYTKLIELYLIRLRKMGETVHICAYLPKIKNDVVLSSVGYGNADGITTKLEKVVLGFSEFLPIYAHFSGRKKKCQKKSCSNLP